MTNRTPMDAASLKQLEDAARAAGYVPVGLTEDGTALLLEGIEQPWNPRDENEHSDCMGDALRLAVKLGMEVYIDNHPEGLNCVEVESVTHRHGGRVIRKLGSNPDAATCLAITTVAAFIGAKEG